MAKSNSSKMHRNVKDLTKLRFGKLSVLSFSGIYRSRARWLCKCDCGKIVEKLGHDLLRGSIKTCGCINPNFRHGKSKCETYNSWSGMIRRTSNQNTPCWIHYGGRGIGVCDRWKTFSVFLKDMGERPKNSTLERIDNNGNYEPSNCRWATRAEQSRNTRQNRIVSYNGISMCIKDWSMRIGIEESSLRERIQKWPLERALTAPKGG